MGVGDGIMEALADGFEGAEIMVLVEELVAAGQIVGVQEADADAIQALLLVRRR
jgi:hypothetical protein